jgi:integrase
MRTIILPKSVASILRQRKMDAIGPWIFPNPVRPEDPVNPSSAYTHMKTLLHHAGLPSIRFHDLRHPYVKPTTKKFITFFEVFRAAS